MHKVSKNPRRAYSRATEYTTADAFMDVKASNPHLPQKDLRRAVAETLRPEGRRPRPLHRLIRRPLMAA